MIKKITLGLIAFICLGSLATQAQQKVNEGYISYAAEYDLPPDQQMAAAMLPKEYKIYYKENLSKFVMDLGMMTNQMTSDSKTNTGLMLMDIPMAKQKIAVKFTEADYEKQKEMMPDYEFSKTTESKVISGYNTIKYNAKDKQTGNQIEIWTTKDLEIPSNSFTQAFKDKIEGTPLVFVTNMNGMKVKLSFKELKAETVTGLNLTIPDGYTQMTMEELMSMSGR